MFVRLVVGPLTRILNPGVMRLAGRRHVRVAGLVHHVGRRSGQAYATPVGARLHDDQIVIPLTFGSRSDWSRNVRAAGWSSIELDGRTYDACAPVLLWRSDARAFLRETFNPIVRLSFRGLGIRQVMVLRATPARIDPR